MKSFKTLYIVVGVLIIAGILWFVANTSSLDSSSETSAESSLRLEDGKKDEPDEPVAELDGSSASGTEGPGQGETAAANMVGEDANLDGEVPPNMGDSSNAEPVAIDPEINSEVLNFEIPQEGDEVQRMDRTFDVIQRAVLYMKETRIILPQPTANKLVKLAVEAYAIDKSDYAPSLIANLLPEYETEIRAGIAVNGELLGAEQFFKAFETIHRLE